MKFFLIKALLLFLLVAQVDLFWQQKNKIQALSCAHQITYDDLYNELALCSLHYFSTLLVKEQPRFYLAHENRDFCQLTSYHLDALPLYLCSDEKDYLSSSFNQLLSTLDSPLMREYCAKKNYCEYRFFTG